MQRTKLGFLLSGLVGIAYTAASVAQKGPAAPDYPTKPIRIIVPQSPGASTDITARLVALGNDVVAGSGADLSAHIDRELNLYAKIIKSAKIAAE